MQTLNNRESYGWATVALHWLAAAGVIAMLWTGFNAGEAEEAHDRARHMQLMGLHISVGVAFFAIWTARIAGHYLQPQPVEAKGPALINFIARATQNLLLLFLALQIISGPLMIWAHARPIQAFGFAIASPFATRNESIDHIADLMHLVGRWGLVAFIALHALAAVKRLVIDRDGVFTRMLIPGAKLKA